MYRQLLIEEGATADGPAQSAAPELLQAFRTGEGVYLIRESVRMVMRELIEAEMTERNWRGSP